MSSLLVLKDQAAASWGSKKRADKNPAQLHEVITTLVSSTHTGENQKHDTLGSSALKRDRTSDVDLNGAGGFEVNRPPIGQRARGLLDEGFIPEAFGTSDGLPMEGLMGATLASPVALL